MTKLGYRIGVSISLSMFGVVGVLAAIFLPRVWANGTPLGLALLGTVLTVAFAALNLAAAWHFRREYREQS
jgi:hypothetical protein